MLGLPESLRLMIVGMMLNGLSCSFIFTPLIPEIIEAVQEKENIDESMELNDKASGLYNTCSAIGCLGAPIVGGACNDFFGFRVTTDIVLIFAIIYCGIFFFLNTLPYFKTQRNEMKRQIMAGNNKYNNEFCEKVLIIGNEEIQMEDI